MTATLGEDLMIKINYNIVKRTKNRDEEFYFY